MGVKLIAPKDSEHLDWQLKENVMGSEVVLQIDGVVHLLRLTGNFMRDGYPIVKYAEGRKDNAEEYALAQQTLRSPGIDQLHESLRKLGR